jgi:hypothetical protein
MLWQTPTACAELFMVMVHVPEICLGFNALQTRFCPSIYASFKTACSSL